MGGGREVESSVVEIAIGVVNFSLFLASRFLSLELVRRDIEQEARAQVVEKVERDRHQRHFLLCVRSRERDDALSSFFSDFF